MEDMQVSLGELVSVRLASINEELTLLIGGTPSAIDAEFPLVDMPAAGVGDFDVDINL
jgi:hypothetical protein